MIAAPQIQLRVVDVEPLGPTLKRFSFEAADGGWLPASAAGAHVVLTLKGPERTWKNAYSIISPPGERRRYQLIIRKVAHSRGGSHFLHDAVSVGDVLQAAVPHNLFPLASLAKKHLLIGGGIGVTPLLSQVAALKAAGARYEMHQVCSEAEAALFARLLQPFAGGDVRLHVGRSACDILAILERQPIGTHVYTCGPGVLIEEVVRAAEHLGWPAVAVHHESFGDHTGGEPFTAVLARSHKEIEVAGDQSLLEAVEAAGVDAPYLCRGGACGQCITRVIEGEPEHRDDFLTAEERAAGNAVMICVSRARTPRLVLDL